MNLNQRSHHWAPYCIDIRYPYGKSAWNHQQSVGHRGPTISPVQPGWFRPPEMCWVAIPWLVLWNMIFYDFPYIGNSHPSWLSYFSEGLKPPTSTYIMPYKTSKQMRFKLLRLRIVLAFCRLCSCRVDKAVLLLYVFWTKIEVWFTLKKLGTLCHMALDDVPICSTVIFPCPKKCSCCLSGATDIDIRRAPGFWCSSTIGPSPRWLDMLWDKCFTATSHINHQSQWFTLQ